eukprot:SAG22_NODE_8146_length_679_cov_1.427586_1_plen_186_part_01
MTRGSATRTPPPPPPPPDTYSTYLPHCVRFFYAARVVLRKSRVEASHPLQTSLEQYRAAVTAPPNAGVHGGAAEWEARVQDSGDQLETLLHEAALHDPIAALLPEPSVLQTPNGSMSQLVPMLWLGDARALLDGPGALVEHGITHICSCCSQLKPRLPDMFKYSHIPVIDSDRANIARYFWKTNAF